MFRKVKESIVICMASIACRHCCYHRHTSPCQSLLLQRVDTNMFGTIEHPSAANNVHNSSAAYNLHAAAYILTEIICLFYEKRAARRWRQNHGYTNAYSQVLANMRCEYGWMFLDFFVWYYLFFSSLFSRLFCLLLLLLELLRRWCLRSNNPYLPCFCIAQKVLSPIR